MGYMAVFMDVTGRPCVVIGGDQVAEERVRALLAAAALVTVISPSLTPGLRVLVDEGAVRYRARAFTAGDLTGFTMAYCADRDPAIGEQAATEARALGLPVNVTDRPELCTFIVPSIVTRGPLQVAISTSGTSPALARVLREELSGQLAPAYAMLLTVLAAARRYRREHEPDPARRAVQARALAELLRDPILAGDYGAADAVLRRDLGCGLADLGIELPPASSDAHAPAARELR